MSIIGAIWEAIKKICAGPMSEAEVDRALSDLAAHRTEHLEWRTSLVDLLKLLDLDSSLKAREALAYELGFEGKFTGSATDNEMLHSFVMRDIENRYTKIPQA